MGDGGADDDGVGAGCLRGGGLVEGVDAALGDQHRGLRERAGELGEQGEVGAGGLLAGGGVAGEGGADELDAEGGRAVGGGCAVAVGHEGSVPAGADLLDGLVELRIAIDLSVAEQLAEIYRGTENPEIEGHVERMREFASAGEPFPEADAAFHTALFSRLPNGLLRQLAQAFWEVHTTAVRLLGIPPAQDILETVEAHRAMLTALEAGDAAAYREAVHEHYRPLGRVLDAAAVGADGPDGAG